MRFLLSLLIFSIASSAYSLEIDEKLTLRFLKVSNSKKTILINRGAEDGLAVGDHAKFFITQGVIARGVVEKVSPSRSIWSMYRIVDPAEITDGKVLNLKIASPVKLTDDPSKSMKEEPIPAGSDKMSMDDGEKEKDSLGNSDADQKELEAMGIEDVNTKKTPSTKAVKKNETKELSNEEIPVISTGKNKKAWEVWSTVFFNSLSGTLTSDASTESKSSTLTSVDISGGVEYYFIHSSGFIKDLSISAFAHKRTLEFGDDTKRTSDAVEFGGAANYHFLNDVTKTNVLIGFAGAFIGTGSTTLTETVETSGATRESSLKGTNTFLGAAIGAKYFLNNGLGFRSILDYYNSTETIKEDKATSTRKLSGPRLQMGISYRF